MTSRYLLLIAYMCFPDKEESMMKQNESIFKVSVQEAMEQVVCNKKSFAYASLRIV
jgi:hypothetical protein